MSEIVLEVKNLSVEFQTEDQCVKAVNSISFQLNKGETLGIVGESGSGKSVTSLSVMRLIPNPPGKITEGEILFFNNSESGINLLALPEKKMRKHRGKDISMIFQEPMTSLNPVYRCGKQITEIIQLHQKLSKKQAKARTIELFNEVMLPRPEEIFKAYPHQLSGGQKQRVMIAMAISCNPSILIADEPTTALDVTVQKNIIELLKSLQEKYNMGIIFITHDLGIIAEIANRVLVMYKGNIVEQGLVSEIFKNPQHPYTKGLLACRPPLDKRLRLLPTVSDFLKVDDHGNQIDTGLSINNFINGLTLSDEERNQNLSSIYSEKPILNLENICKYYPLSTSIFKKRNYLKACDEINFEIFEGETLGLVGESGCGKTTLGRTILRLIEPTSGKITYKDNDVTKLSSSKLRKLRKEIQIIFQDPYSSLNPRITIGRAILEPMKVHGLYKNDKTRKLKVIELMERVGLTEAQFNRYPHEFSGGQRQRIVIARTLAVEPKFIICDESVSALDVSVQAQVLNLLNELKHERKFTYLFISHDLSVVKFMSDRIVVMKDGRIQEIGDADQIYYSPTTDYTRSLIEAIPKGL
ncbi:MAG: ABC transporter ATP-binding protein [Bacteroidetes bacterium]|nr:ABC transporter ATP-binding protein [Bacteroidota bacterium]